jgi:hypothetical protein
VDALQADEAGGTYLVFIPSAEHRLHQVNDRDLYNQVQDQTETIQIDDVTT